GSNAHPKNRAREQPARDFFRHLRPYLALGIFRGTTQRSALNLAVDEIVATPVPNGDAHCDGDRFSVPYESHRDLPFDNWVGMEPDWDLLEVRRREMERLRGRLRRRDSLRAGGYHVRGRDDLKVTRAGGRQFPCESRHPLRRDGVRRSGRLVDEVGD